MTQTMPQIITAAKFGRLQSQGRPQTKSLLSFLVEFFRPEHERREAAILEQFSGRGWSDSTERDLHEGLRGNVNRWL